MRAGEFRQMYSIARKRYHTDAPDFTSPMDALVKGCDAEQWRLVQWASDNKFPPFDAVVAERETRRTAGAGLRSEGGE